MYRKKNENIFQIDRYFKNYGKLASREAVIHGVYSYRYLGKIYQKNIKKYKYP